MFRLIKQVWDHRAKVLSSLSHLAVLLAIISFFCEMEDRKESRLLAAWQVVTTKASGNSGKIRALEYLHENGESLVGIDLAHEEHLAPDGNIRVGPYLNRLKLVGADLSRARFVGAIMVDADLRNSAFWGSDFSGVLLEGSDFSNANMQQAQFMSAGLEGVNFYKTDLRGAKELTCLQLSAAKNWESSYRDPSLACGQNIPTKDEDKHP